MFYVLVLYWLSNAPYHLDIPWYLWTVAWLRVIAALVEGIAKMKDR